MMVHIGTETCGQAISSANIEILTKFVFALVFKLLIRTIYN